ncbi:MAG: divalent-cation tolerance protein CutA [Terriglobales bacterium]
MTDAIVVFTTCATAEEAERIAAAVVERKLAACASAGAPLRSHYRWRGKVETATEIPLTIKTAKDCFPALEAAIRELHSYETPEILALPVERGSAAYLAWIEAGTACASIE